MSETKSSKLNRVNNNKNARQVLGDVTNRVSNNGFSLVDRTPLSGRKRVAENSAGNGDDDDDDSLFWKQVSLVVEKLENETRHVAKRPRLGPNEATLSPLKCPGLGPNEVGLSPLRGGKTYRLQSGGKDDVVEGFGTTLDCIDLGENQHLLSVENVGGVVEEGGFLGETECRGGGTRGLSDGGESDCNREELAMQVVSDNAKSVAGDSMTSSRSESVETSRFTDSPEAQSFGLEKCTLLKGDGSGTSGVDLIKNCCCSFCTKAAYMWSDLQCQDLKGRISTLARSQTEASNLARKHSAETAMGVAQGTSSTGPHLEANLLTLWKSLFFHMENNFAAESSQLQSNLAVLQDVREDYKMNLEMINEMIPDIQQYSFDASEL
ncbi:hypothetical protein vseg_019350 [Gypsophila vaccaria]